MLMEEMAGLYFMQGDDDILEESNMFFPERHSESWDDACQDVEQLRCAIEFEGFMNERVEAVIDGLSDHLSPWH